MIAKKNYLNFKDANEVVKDFRVLELIFWEPRQKTLIK